MHVLTCMHVYSGENVLSKPTNDNDHPTHYTHTTHACTYLRIHSPLHVLTRCVYTSLTLRIINIIMGRINVCV